jgi:hypothetical protein
VLKRPKEWGEATDARKSRPVEGTRKERGSKKELKLLGEGKKIEEAKRYSVC